MEEVELRARFVGRVQGVFFRATTREIAKSLGVVGTVRNVEDGSVELFAIGKKEVLDALLKELQTRFSCKVEVEFYAPIREFIDFRVVYHD